MDKMNRIRNELAKLHAMKEMISGMVTEGRTSEEELAAAACLIKMECNCKKCPLKRVCAQHTEGGQHE